MGSLITGIADQAQTKYTITQINTYDHSGNLEKLFLSIMPNKLQ